MKQKTKILMITFLSFLLGNLFLISAVSIKDVSTSPQEVVPGQIIEVSIEIENIFEYDVTNLNVNLNLSGDIPFAPHQSSSEKSLDELRDGDEETFKFKLIALPSAQSGIYKIPVTIGYNDGEEDISKAGLISLIVNSEPELKISLDDSAALIKGKENTISIKIINSGLTDVKFVYVNVNDVSGVKFLSEKEEYIGDIDSDDFDSVEYKAYISATAPETINLPVILKFKDATNKEFIESESIILKTYSLKEAQGLGLVKKPRYALYLIIVILILAYVSYRILKKRKLKRNRS